MYVYFIRAGNSGAIKIGMAVNIERRMNTLQTGNAFKLNIIALIPCDTREQALYLEQRLHRCFNSQHIRGEWFQGNIDFTKINNIVGVDDGVHPLKRAMINRKQRRKGIKKRREKRLKDANKILN